MKDIFNTTTIGASIAVAIALVFLVHSKPGANTGPLIVSSHATNAD